MITYVTMQDWVYKGCTLPRVSIHPIDPQVSVLTPLSCMYPVAGSTALPQCNLGNKIKYIAHDQPTIQFPKRKNFGVATMRSCLSGPLTLLLRTQEAGCVSTAHLKDLRLKSHSRSSFPNLPNLAQLDIYRIRC